MANRASPEAAAEVVLTNMEIAFPNRMAVPAGPPARPTVAYYLLAIAKLGGYLARAEDPPPGNMVLW
jgi:hypothetical protein